MYHDQDRLIFFVQVTAGVHFEVQNAISRPVILQLLSTIHSIFCFQFSTLKDVVEILSSGPRSAIRLLLWRPQAGRRDFSTRVLLI